MHVDQIYRTRANRRYCKEKGIRLSGPPLGKPIREAALRKEQQRRRRQDEIDRIAVEGKFGQGKRRFSLARIMTKLARTSEVAITITFMVMNLEKILSAIVFLLRVVAMAAQMPSIQQPERDNPDTQHRCRRRLSVSINPETTQRALFSKP